MTSSRLPNDLAEEGHLNDGVEPNAEHIELLTKAVRQRRRLIFDVSMTLTLLSILAGCVFFYATYSSPWLSADEMIGAIDIPAAVTSVRFENSTAVPDLEMMSLIESGGKIAGPLVLLMGTVTAMLGRSLVPLALSIFLALSLGALSTSVAKRSAEFQDLPREANALKFESTRQLLITGQVSAAQQNYILAQMELVSGRGASSPLNVESGLAKRIEVLDRDIRAGGLDEHARTVLYRMEREIFGDVRTQTGRAYAAEIDDARRSLSLTSLIAGLVGISALICALMLWARVLGMRARESRIADLAAKLRE